MLPGDKQHEENQQQNTDTYQVTILKQFYLNFIVLIHLKQHRSRKWGANFSANSLNKLKDRLQVFLH